MIDFHCHLDLYPDPSSVLSRVVQHELYVLAVTTTPLAWNGTCRIVGDTPRVRVALGLHPQVVAERHAEVDLLCSLVPGAPYIGEVGLDGSRDYAASLELQREVLEKVLAACAAHGGRIISLHSRRAVREVLDLVEAQPECGTPVLHWFSGSMRDLTRAIQLGCWFSVGPAMLRSESGRRLTASMPRERVLTETDGPFTRVGRTSLMPWDVRDAERELARLWQCPEETVQATLVGNLRRLIT